LDQARNSEIEPGLIIIKFQRNKKAGKNQKIPFPVHGSLLIFSNDRCNPFTRSGMLILPAFPAVGL
jgi:hypothetical protein